MGGPGFCGSWIRKKTWNPKPTSFLNGWKLVKNTYFWLIMIWNYPNNYVAVSGEGHLQKLLPQDELIKFLCHPLTASLYFRNWCLPFFCEKTMDECLQMIANLGLLHGDPVTDTEWFANPVFGASLPPPRAADRFQAWLKVQKKWSRRHLDGGFPNFGSADMFSYIGGWRFLHSSKRRSTSEQGSNPCLGVLYWGLYYPLIWGLQKVNIRIHGMS